MRLRALITNAFSLALICITSAKNICKNLDKTRMMCYIKGREISIFHRLFCFEKVMQNGELCFVLFVNFVCKYSIYQIWLFVNKQITKNGIFVVCDKKLLRIYCKTNKQILQEVILCV